MHEITTHSKLSEMQQQKSFVIKLYQTVLTEFKPSASKVYYNVVVVRPNSNVIYFYLYKRASQR